MHHVTAPPWYKDLISTHKPPGKGPSIFMRISYTGHYTFDIVKCRLFELFRQMSAYFISTQIIQEIVIIILWHQVTRVRQMSCESQQGKCVNNSEYNF